jgi:uncharacterized protein YdeI (YjbR/CyaY-like superfamily)
MGSKRLPGAPTPSPRHFASQAAFRRWLERHHGSASELWVGFYKKGSGRGGITYRHALDEALSYGWIDGRVKRVDEASFMIRFTPRRPGSIWSAVNLKRMKELIALGVVAKPGLETYETRDRRKAGMYSFENRPQTLARPLEHKFRARAGAWTFFNAQPPGYRRVCIFYVMSAKKDETRERRLDLLMRLSSEGKRLTWM